MKKRIKKYLWPILIGIAVVIGVGLAMLYLKVQADIRELSNAINTPTVQVTSLRDQAVEVAQGQPMNILIIGSDGDDQARSEDAGYVSRSDSMMILSINPQTKSTKMLSIPRDTLALIDGYDEPDKLNHSFAYGGIDLTIETVQDFLQVPIDYYAVVNMAGLAQVVDAIDGIEITSPLTFEYRGTGFVEGQTRHVNGVKAMNFARMRYDDPLGEVGRQNRQKLVIKAIIDKVLSLNALTYYPRLLKVAADNVQTNFDLSQLLTTYRLYVPAFNSLTAIQFEDLEDLYLNDVFYFHIPVASRLKVANILRQQTDLPPIGQSALIDPLEDDSLTYVKAKTIIMNQYPSGLTQEQIQAIEDQQAAINAARQANEVPAYQETWPSTYESPQVPVSPSPADPVYTLEEDLPVTESSVVSPDPVVTEPSIAPEESQVPAVEEVGQP